ncbi:MAG: inorganic pyrophosphatase [Anaerolineae bacterium]|nr:inorganic pyrophosphatase [Anaerolineae bacterium]
MVIPPPSEAFWSSLAALVRDANLVIDRPRGSRHPRYPDAVYPLDYGYLADTRSGDEAGIDVWVSSSNSQEVTGIVCTVDTDKRDAEIKILLGCTETDLGKIIAFHSQGSQKAWGLLREP